MDFAKLSLFGRLCKKIANFIGNKMNELCAAGSTGKCKISDLFEESILRSIKIEFFTGPEV